MCKVVTISREYGAGGHSIGKAVAKELGIPFYDNDIVKETAIQSGFEKELVEQEEEDISTFESIFKSICDVSSRYYHDTQDEIHEIQKALFIRLANNGPCVILGRCADQILREAHIPCLNVFIHADEVHRAVRVSEITGVKNATELQKLIVKRDTSRHNYYNRYTGKRWGDSKNYDLTLDSGRLGYDLCVKLIAAAAADDPAPDEQG